MLSQLALLTLAASSVYGHAFVNSVSGANGLSAVGLGVTTNGEVPRGGTTEQPFQLDTPVLKNLKDDPCGATLLAGSVKIPESMAKIAATNGGQFPSIPTDGKLTMGIFQVNADGGGPFKAEINEDATGKTWAPIEVLSQPPGKAGLLHNGPANSTITVAVPAAVKCTGGANKNACLIRLNNGGPGTGSVANGAGPFGGCAAVQQGAAGASNAGAANAVNGAGAAVVAGTAGTAGAAGAAAAAAAATAPTKIGDSIIFARREAIAELQRRQKLTQHMIDELKTATGTAIDIPIDALAGHDDAAALGGNSTESAPGAVLTTQQAVNLKKAVAGAIAQALAIMAADDEIDAGAGGTSEAAANKANADAAAALSAGEIKSINAGNAGVGAVQTEVVASLLGDVATATAALAKGAATGVVQATVTKVAAAGVAQATAAAATNAAAGQGKPGRKEQGKFKGFKQGGRVRSAKFARHLFAEEE